VIVAFSIVLAVHLKAGVSKTTPKAYALGHSDIIFEWAAHPKTPQAFRWANELRLATSNADDPLAAGTIKMVEITIDNLPKTKIDARGIPFSVVGRPVAAIRLRRGKNAEWIREGQCSAQK
jgi:hypothetical protein